MVTGKSDEMPPFIVDAEQVSVANDDDATQKRPIRTASGVAGGAK